MLDPKELHRIAAMKKAEQEAKEREDKEKKEQAVQKRFTEYVACIEAKMKEAACEGRFCAEVEISGGDEVKRRLEVYFYKFNPKWYGDGWTKDYINVSW